MPMTKERYLSQYENFIQEVSEEYREYNKETWKLKDEEFKEFARSLFGEYEDEMTEEEVEKAVTLRLEYNALKIKGKAGNFINNVESELHDLLNK